MRQTPEIRLLREAQEFLDDLPLKARHKVLYNTQMLALGMMDAKIFKKLRGTDIWEIRTLYDGIAYRLFAFWDTRKQALVVATHGILKKTDKTPTKEIDKAEQIRKEYFGLK